MILWIKIWVSVALWTIRKCGHTGFTFFPGSDFLDGVIGTLTLKVACFHYPSYSVLLTQFAERIHTTRLAPASIWIWTPCQLLLFPVPALHFLAEHFLSILCHPIRFGGVFREFGRIWRQYSCFQIWVKVLHFSSLIIKTLWVILCLLNLRL